MKLDFFKFIFRGLTVIVLPLILNNTALAQGCSAVLKITDPAPVCFPLTVDLTMASITAGSTEGLSFSYYVNPELSVKVLNPGMVGAGTYYIKGNLSGDRIAWVAGSVKVIAFEKPRLVITSPILKHSNETVDLTLPNIKAGSDAGLIFSYWIDNEATKALSTPGSTGKGSYFIKGTSTAGCFDILPVTVNDL